MKTLSVSMRNQSSIVIRIVILLLLIAASPVTGLGQQPTKQRSTELIDRVLERFITAERDFSDFAKAKEPCSLEYVVYSSLEDIADEAAGFAFISRTLMFIYGSLIDGQDREVTQLTIVLVIKGYIEKLDILISRVNKNIAHIKLPGVAASALSLKKDLQEFKSLLESIKKGGFVEESVFFRR
jgi:hypothetical protein